jgi:hypothetical protein
MRSSFLVPLLWVSLLAAPAAWAISPGSADRKAALPNVCAQGPLQGSLCDPTDPDPCGSDLRDRPFECAVDFPAVPTLRGTLTLVSDEAVGDNTSSGGNPTITLLMEFENGLERYFVAKTFQNASAPEAAFPTIGHWLAPAAEDEIDAVVDSWFYQTPFASLEDVGTALREVARELFGSQLAVSATTPVIFDLEEVSNRPATDQYVGTDLGQVARFRVQIKFVEP